MELITEYADLKEFNNYQLLLRRTASEEQSYSERLTEYALGLVTEGGEAGDIIKKVVFHKHNLDKDALKKELGDTLWYLSRLADECGLTLQEIAEANIEKSAGRYPEGFSVERSINRKE